MSRRAELIDAVLENPGDDATCLAFADWLDEHARSLPAAERPSVVARAEFVRLRLRLAALPEGLDRDAVRERGDRLLNQHQRSWPVAYGYSGEDCPRGFLHLSLSDEQFEQVVPAALKVEPVFAHVLARKWNRRDNATAEFLERFKSGPHLRAVTGLCTVDLTLGPSGIAQVFSSPYLKHVTTVAVLGDNIGLEGVRAIAESPAPFRLGVLTLERAIKPPKVRAVVEYIAQSPRFAHLHELALPFNGLNNRCIEALLASATLPPRLRLYVHNNPYDRAAFARQLAARFGVPG